jgi:hypothetical protein
MLPGGAVFAMFSITRIPQYISIHIELVQALPYSPDTVAPSKIQNCAYVLKNALPIEQTEH